MKKLIFIISFLTASVCLAAQTQANGFGDNQESARANAMAELSFIIYSDVAASLSQSSVTDMNTAEQQMTKQIDITTALPVIGARISTEKTDDGYKCTAAIGEYSIPAYYANLKEASSALAELNTKYKSADDTEKYRILRAMASLRDNFDKLNRVYVYLTGKSYQTDVPDKQWIAASTAAMTDKFTSMRLCASVMAGELSGRNVYLYYPMYEGSDEVTEFSEAFRDMLAQGLKTVKDINSADSFISADYAVTHDGMFITAYLTDKDGKTVKTSSKVLAPSAYKNYETKPSSLSIEKLLKEGLVKSSDLTARITTNNGKKAVLYKKGDTVELFIKVNRPSYVYITGHVAKMKEKYSYLLDLYDAGGDRRFIRYIDGDDVNRWLSVGQFKVVPPFGTEMFQMIASENDPDGKLPAYEYNSQNGIYKIADKPEQGVVAVRALKRLKSDKEAVAEDVLVFTSTDK